MLERKRQIVIKVYFESFHRLLEVSEWHARQCKDNLQSTKIVKKGHVVKTNLKCRNEDKPHICPGRRLHTCLLKNI